ncbi:hypothetical protein Acsp04_11380 [Actinomadura sp. NBRC 104425]|uniref:DUF3105 domain-containing protein n=1 Tax=Actinomadura sp. NBRC 104425 TaxID=3032204 RepID=UPI0024A0330E|nr:DUF3105 domain-containing protein [Actinomadura sp. NBRC 104425]GLZ10903.1 hypothetical protein Acsp04_11380 [Actinomadura sp. NBRC 104425]
MSKSARTRARNQNQRNNQQNRSRGRKNALTKREVPWGGIVFFTVIGVVAVVAIAFAFMQTREPSASETAAISGVVEKDGLSRDHTSGTVQYDTDPPMGGAHDPVWQNCDGRVYDQPLRNENAVHSLEHGAVWITYRPGLAGDQLDRLKDRVEGTDYTMLSPYPGLDAPIALSAWGRQLKVQDASDARIDAFLRAYVKGPQTPEPGAACDGAKDTP